MADVVQERKEFIRDFIKNNPTCESSELYDALEEGWPSIARGGHRSLVYREIPEEDRPWTQGRECPKCDVKAEGLDAIEGVFGFRNMGNGVRRAQSWCRECRKEDARKRRMRKKKEDAQRLAEEASEQTTEVEEPEVVETETVEAVETEKPTEAEEPKPEKEKLSLSEMTPEQVMESYTVPQLKKELRALELKVGGRKEALVERLQKALN